MKKTVSVLLSLLLILSLFSACASQSASETTAVTETQAATEAPAETAAQTEAASADTKIVVDAYGNEVEIPAKVDRLVETSYAPLSSLIYVVTGRSDVMVAMSQTAAEGYDISMWKALEPGLQPNVASIIKDGAINFEELAKYQPQVVLCNKSVYDANAEQLKAIGVVPVMIKFGNFEDVQEVIRIVGEIFDCQDRAADLIAYQKGILSYFDQKAGELPAEKTKALYLSRSNDDGTYKVFTGKHLASKMLAAAGFQNVAQDLEESTIVTVDMEQILAWDPDVIFLSNFDSFTPASFTDGTQGEFWKQISAVKNRKIYKTPVGMYRWDTFCVETPLMVKWLGQVGNPAIFTEYNIETDIRDFYSTYMNYDLTEDDLAKILNNDVNIYLEQN